MGGIKLSRGRHRSRSKGGGPRSLARRESVRESVVVLESKREPFRDPIREPTRETRREPTREPIQIDVPPEPAQKAVYSPPRIARRSSDVPNSLYVVQGKIGRAPSADSQLTDDVAFANHRRQFHRHESSSYEGRSPRQQHSYASDTLDSSRRQASFRAAPRDRSETSYRLHSDVKPPSPKHRQKLNKWYRKQNPILSNSLSDGTDDSYTVTISGTEAGMSLEGAGMGRDKLAEAKSRTMVAMEEDDYLRTKQSVAVLAIALTAAQLLVLVMQFTLCGMAPFDVNILVGPYPDAFSVWGGKNAYLMLHNNEWWRLVSPSLLHVGVLHLLANCFCQLDAIALFEREWGSFRWLIVYLVSSVGVNAFSSTFDPDTIGVGSSGALMGMYGAKLAQVTTLTCFDVKSFKVDEVVQLDQLSSVLCGLTLVSLLSSLEYIDWSGHMGGLLCGFLSGIVLFSSPIESCCAWFFWLSLGLLSLSACLTAILYFFIAIVKPNEELADVCEYLRSAGVLPEDYECNCMWEL